MKQPHGLGLWRVDHWRVAEVQVNSQLTAIAQSPACTDRRVTEHVRAECLGAGQMRKEAASLFIRAGKTADIEVKKQLLVDSYQMLKEILVKFPQTDLLDKVHQNITILEKQIRKIDPALLEGLQQESVSAVPDESPAPIQSQGVQ